jgi:apolipoprotein N-acyltransferase
MLAQMFWVIELVQRWTGGFWLAVIPWILSGFVGALFLAFAGTLLRSALIRNLIWAAPLLWTGIEILRSFTPGLAFPWFLASTSLTAFPAIDQLAFFGTQFLVSAWICLINVLIAQSLLKRPVAASYWYGVLVFPLISLAWYSRPLSTSPMRIALGQPGFDMAFGDERIRDVELARRIDRLETLAVQAHAALLVLPEGVIGAGDIPPEPDFDLPKGLPLLFGGQRGHEPAYQTAFLYDNGGWSYADKSRLVVFGEYVPGRDFIPFLKDFKLPSGDLTPASQVTALHMPNLMIGPMLCFEALFYDVAHKQSENGAQVLAGMSIDDWYMGTNAPEQLADAATWRAIETGLPVVRSASTGYTLAVDQKGRKMGELALGVSDNLVVDVPVEAHPLRNPFRPIFPWLVGLFPFGFIGFCYLERYRATRE